MEQLNSKEIAKEMAYSINNFGFNRNQFCETMAQQHRYLQSEFTNLCLRWLEYASEQYETGNYDGRNEFTCSIANKISKYLDNN